MSKNKNKTVILNVEETKSKPKIVLESEDSQEGPIWEVVDKELYKAIAKAVAYYVVNEPKYVFDYDYCEEFSYKYSQDGFDEDKLIYIEGDHDPKDYNTLYDFMNTSSNDYETDYNWGKYSYRENPIDFSVLMKAKDFMNENYDELVNKINVLPDDNIFKEVYLKEETVITRKEVVLNKTYNNTTENITQNTISKRIGEVPKDYYNDSYKKEAVDAILKTLNLDSYYAPDYFVYYYESIQNQDFKNIYLEGCSQLGYKDKSYKTIKFSGNEKEELLYSLINKFVKRNVSQIKPNVENAIKSCSHINTECTELGQCFYIDNGHSSIRNSKDYIKESIYKYGENLENYNEYIKLLAAILAYEIGQVPILKLKEVFQVEELLDKIFEHEIGIIIDMLYQEYKTRESIKRVLPREPKDYYPNARKINRKFILHVGPTNSGKTFESLQQLKASKSGIYLAPLRLLALEVQEKMNKDNVKCSLLTGEEEEFIEDATHICSTIEKLNFYQEYDMAIIDEAQMLEDYQRGSAWTAAILGLCAKEIHICMASYAKNIVIELINYCGDSYQIVEHTRDTELIVEKKSFDFLEDIQNGDAIVAFSKRKVLNIAAAINTKTNKTCSVLFGALPYKSRKKQFEDFSEGRTDILVTTDAIGMGVNLAIRRIIYMEDSKFDGKEMRKLKSSELLQISGRAGRKNIYDQGYVLMRDKNMINEYKRDIPELSKVYVGLTSHLCDVEGGIEDIIYAWENVNFNKPFVKADISNVKKILLHISDLSLRKNDKYKALFLPVNLDSPYEAELFHSYLSRISYNLADISFPRMPEIEYDNELKQLEDYSKGIDLYYSFCKVYGLTLDLNRVNKERERTCSKINNLLLSDSLETPKCNCCGRELEWDDNRYKCYRCYSGYRYSGYYEEEDWDDDDDWDDDF